MFAIRIAAVMGVVHTWILLLILLTDVGVSICPSPCACRRQESSSEPYQYHVDCRQRNLTHVPDLRGLLSLPRLAKWVTLGLNRIEQIERREFPRGLNITYLSLESNRRLHIAPDGLANLGETLLGLSLEQAGLFFNSTFTFLRGLPRLLELNLRGNNIRDFRPGDPHVTAALFHELGLASLRKVDLRDNMLGSLHTNSLQGLDKLEELCLGDNQLQEVPRNALRRLTRLKELDLSRNRIASLGQNEFPGLRSLRFLHLMGNRINVVDAKAFSSLKSSLQTLDFSDCHLLTAPTPSLKPLRFLESLTLSNNPLVSFGTQSLAGKYCLRRLDLSGTPVPLRPDTFEKQARCLQVLKLGNMGLETVPRDALYSLRALQELHLDHNYISVLQSEALAGVSAKTLIFTGCPLEDIQYGAFNHTQGPLSVVLDNTAIRDLDFVFDYPYGTFRWINASDTSMTCSCNLPIVRDRVEPGRLVGDCRYDRATVGLGSPQLENALRDCRPASLMNVNPQTSGAARYGSAWLMLVTMSASWAFAIV